MKKLAFALLLATILLCMPVSALASSFGVSPSSAELEVPKDGSATYDFTIYGIDGVVNIDLEDIPLSVNPTSVEVYDGETITVTFYGDGTNNTYEGKIRFVAMMGEQVAAGIKVQLTVHINCSTEVVDPSPIGGAGDGGGATDYTVETNIFGASGSFVTDYKGKVLEDFGVTSEDGVLSLQIDEGTIALDKDGKRLGTLEASEFDDPPAPPEGKDIIGLPYDFGPDGATFNPPIMIEWQYDPDVDPEGLVIAYYDGTQWVELPCTVDYENGVIIAEVVHFSVFAMLAVAEIPEEPVAPAPIIAPPIPAPVIPTPVPAPIPAPAPVEPTPAPQPAPAPPAPALPPMVEDEGLSGGAIAAIIIGITILMVGVVFFIVRSRRKIYGEYRE